jgi:hypothetical protein
MSRRFDTRGGFAPVRDVLSEPSPPHGLVEEKMAWTLRVVLDDFPASFKVP